MSFSSSCVDTFIEKIGVFLQILVSISNVGIGVFSHNLNIKSKCIEMFVSTIIFEMMKLWMCFMQFHHKFIICF